MGHSAKPTVLFVVVSSPQGWGIVRNKKIKRASFYPGGGAGPGARTLGGTGRWGQGRRAASKRRGLPGNAQSAG